MVIRGAKYPRKKDEFYRTPPETTHAMLKIVAFDRPVCDPACGDGAIMQVLTIWDIAAKGRDLKDGYNFLTDPFPWPDCDIVTNPPFGPGGKTALLFVQRALQVCKGTIVMLLPVDFDSGKTRAGIFRDCKQFACKIVLLNRIRWFNGVSGSTNHAWFVWYHKFKGFPRILYTEQDYG
jgi:hypothetical protein